MNSSVSNYENDQPLHIDYAESYDNALVEIPDLRKENPVTEPHLEEPNKHSNYPHVLLLARIARHSSISVEKHKESNDAHVVSQHHKLEIMSYPLAGTLISHVFVVFSQLKLHKIFIFTILLLADILFKPVVKAVESHID